MFHGLYHTATSLLMSWLLWNQNIHYNMFIFIHQK